MSKAARKMSRAAQRAAAKLQEAPKPVRFRFIGLQAQVQIEVLNDEGKVRARTLLANQDGVITLHLVEEHLDKLNREALMGILKDARIEPTD